MVNRERRSRGSLYDFAPTAATYDRWYSTPVGRAHDRQQKRLVRRFLPPIGPGHCLLDVGCGTGHWSRFFADLGFLVTGLDLSPEMIEVARSSARDGCQFLVADAHELPFADGAFDLVTAMVVLEFVPDPGLAVAEMARCARFPGHLLIGALNEESPPNRQRIAERKEPYCSGHIFTASRLGRLLSRFGHVRMGVTPEHVKSPGPPSASPELRLGSWDTAGKGAFIVAEVRL
jgi:ubiquinone/menaquinone biosynthesis C-methylase UbiE